MHNHLPDEILAQILSPALKVSDDVFSDTTDTSPFAAYSLSSSAYLLVCKSWLNVATPLLYKPNSLEKVLRANPDFGRFIKKLRVEGGYGPAMHTIISSSPNITDLFLSLSIWSSDSVVGLCKTLPLISPRNVYVVSHKALKNKPRNSLQDSIVSCIPKWTHMETFNFPASMYAESSLAFATALSKSLSLTTVSITLQYPFIPEYLVPLCACPTFEVLKFNIFNRAWPEIMNPVQLSLRRNGHNTMQTRVMEQIRVHPTLKRLRLVRCDPFADEIKVSPIVSEIVPSLNPFFIPMKSASHQIQELVWKQVLFFALYVEEFDSTSFSRRPSESYPSRFPLLLISKTFHKLALPIFCRFPILSPTGTHSFARHLAAHPSFGVHVRFLCLQGATISDHFLFSIFSATTRLERIAGPPKTQISRIPPLGPYISPVISTRAFEMLATTAGSTLREVSIRLESPKKLFGKTASASLSVFAAFTELRLLQLDAPLPFQPEPNPPASVPNRLPKLHTLCLGDNGLQFDSFCEMKLDLLCKLSLPDSFSPTMTDPLARLLKSHGQKLSELRLAVKYLDAVPIFDLCPNLIDIVFSGMTTNPTLFSSSAPHASLTKITFASPYDFSKKDPVDWKRVLGSIDPRVSTSLREVQICCFSWPTTEREIAKSSWVPLAESLLPKNINVCDRAGKCWVPRLQSSKR
ncbi:hypothetical protein C8J57DRAFT_1338999 [Mycena rebaudengoi]|nr:hypothetical protein C8J57DRAFT_1338999 [Mycena rebaudengoi]